MTADSILDLDLLDELLEDEGVELRPQVRIVKRPDPKRSVLSYQQQPLWFLYSLYPTSNAYNIAGALRLRGPVDHAAMQRAIDAIVERHEALRTRFVEIEGQAWQIIEPSLKVPIEQIEVSHFTAQERDATIAHFSSQPLDLREGPIIRVCLIRSGTNEHVLVVLIHHIVCDGWSVGIFRSELTELYRCFATNEKPALPPLPIQYGDYAYWQREVEPADRCEEELAYWQAKLADLPTIWLPWDRPRMEDAQQVQANSITTQISSSATVALRHLAQEHDATMAMTLMAAFQVLLHRYSGQTDFPIGMASANRTHPDIEPLIGFFVNMLVIRADMQGTPSFTAVVERTRDSMVEAFAHANVPFELVVDRLKPNRRANLNPLFQVSFVFQNFPARNFQLSGLKIEPLGKDLTGRFDLELFVADDDSGLNLNWVYDARLFNESTIQHLTAAYGYLLEQVGVNPNMTIDALRLVRPNAANEMLAVRERARRTFDVAATLPELFSHTATRFPGRTALVDGDRRWRYQEVEEISNRMAHYLLSQGVTPGAFVGLYRQRSADMAISILAILKAGAAYVPVDPMYPTERVRFILGDSRLQWVVADAELHHQLGAGDRRLLSLAPLDWQDQPSTLPSVDISPESIAYVIYTSGSTGHPKGCLVTHRNVVRLMRATEHWFGFHERDVWTLFHSYAFDFSVWEIWGAWFYGGKLVIVPHAVSRDTEAFYDLLCTQRVTVLNQTPSAFSALAAVDLRSERDAELALRYVIFGGEALEISSLRPWFERHGDQFPQLVNMYGITETTVHVTYRPITMLDVLRHRGSVIGEPIPDLSLHLLDGHQNAVPPGAIGEIYVGGAGVSAGYLDRPELNRERFVPNPIDPTERWYRSGDFGRYTSENDVEYLGRADQQIKIRGFRIETGEIRAHIQKMPAVHDSFVAVHKATGGNQLIAYVVPDQSFLAHPERENPLANTQIDQWKTTFDNIYTRDNPTGREDFNTAGWLESYTGDQIPDHQMREWLDNTLAAIGSLKTSRVLEIGCGTGMLLLALAPHAKEYVGLDFSQATIQALHKTLARHSLAHVELFQRTADDLDFFRGRQFDTIIINSVIQYFPDAGYLVRVLQSAVSLLADDGVLFAGDIRNLALIDAYRASIEWDRASADASRHVLAERHRQGVLHEEELLLDPAFFTALTTTLPGIAAVVPCAKPGTYVNELNKYRYDVFLCRSRATGDRLAKLGRQPSRAVLDALRTEEAILAWMRGAGAGSCRGNAKLPALSESAFHPLRSRGKPTHNQPVVAQAIRRMPVDVRSHLEKLVPAYMIPTHIIVLESLPLTTHGKIDTHALPKPLIESHAVREAIEAPQMGTESRLAALWCDLLQIRDLSRNADFFALGGHSLLATQLIVRINRTFGINLPLRRIFDEPTLVGFARLLDREVSQSSLDQVSIPRAPRTEFMPLATGQHRLWLVEQIFPNQSTYNTYQAVQIRGALDIDALQCALDFIIHRHEILRTSIAMVGDRPMQRIHEDVSCRIEKRYDDTSPDDRLRAEQTQRIMADVERPFVLEQAPLLRVVVVEHHASCFTLVLVAHHMITDGWSLGVLIRELNASYRAFRHKETPSLPPLPIQYADYAVWQTQWLTSNAAAEQRAFWLQQLSEAPIESTLPHDPQPGDYPPAAGNLATRRLGPALSAAVLQLGLRHQATLFMVLGAALYALLYRATGQKDLTIGAPIAQRNHRDLEPLIGFFVNTLALRARIHAGQTFAQLLDQVRQTTLGGYANQEYPFERLVEELVTNRDSAQNPLFQVMLVVQNQPTTNFDWDGAACVPHELPGHTAKFDLTLFAGEAADREIVLTAEYRRANYGAALIDTYLEALERILAQAAQNPNLPLGALTLARDHAAIQHNKDWPELLLELVSRTTKQFSRAAAIEYEGACLTYAELERESNQIAWALKNAGVKPEDRVAVVTLPHIGVISLFLGILKAGGVWLPLDPRHPARRLHEIVQNAQPTVIISDTEVSFTALGPVSLWTHGMLRERITNESTDAPITAICPEQLAYIIYTSGSTGMPKGVMVTHRSMANLARTEIRHYGTKHGDRVLLAANLTFDASISEIVNVLVSGATLVMLPPERLLPDVQLVNRLRSLRITWWTIRPSYVSLLEDRDFPSLRTLIFAGERLESEIFAPWLHKDRRIFNAYGPTETTVCASCQLLENSDEQPTIGKPLDNVSMVVLDAELGITPYEVVGDIYIGGIGVTRGYLGRPGLSAERFVPNPFSSEPGARMYRSGDRGKRLSNGTIVCLGRSDFQIKLRGYRIDPSEIEGCLRQLPEIHDAVVSLHRDSKRGDLLVAHVVTDVRDDEIEKRIFAHIRERLPEYMQPQQIVSLRQLPLSANGKLDRRALVVPDKTQARTSSTENGDAPRTSFEWQMCLLFERILNHAPIGVEQNFFELGGHSFLAVRLVSEIARELGVQLPVSQVFVSPTVRALCASIEGQTPLHAQAGLVPLRKHGQQAPLFLLHQAGGYVHSYFPLVRHLDARLPVYGLQPPGLDGQSAPVADVVALATRYRDVVRTVQPQGPYHLAGHSFGAVLAYEMARQWLAEGETIEYLGLIDTYLPDGRTQDPLNDLGAFQFVTKQIATLFGAELNVGFTVDAGPEQWAQETAHVLFAAGFATDRTTAQHYVTGLYNVYKACVAAFGAYKPIPCQIHANVYLTEGLDLFMKSQPSLAWTNWLGNDVRVHLIAGEHLDILQEPHVSTLARSINQHLPPFTK